MKTSHLVLTVTVLSLLLLASCAPEANPYGAPPATEPAGFWKGLWHGIICPITFVISLFSDSIGMYEVRNTGGWYDFGFLLGAIIAFGGGGSGASRSGRNGC